MSHQPVADVGEVLRGVLQAVHVLNRFVRWAAHPGQAEQVGERAVQRHVVPVEGVGAERDVIESYQVHAVQKVVHHRLEGVPGMRVRQRGVRGGRHADHPARLGDRPQHRVRLHPGRVPHPACPGVRDEDRFAGLRAGVKRRPVGGVRQVDGEPQLVHPDHRPVAERGQPPVGWLAQPAAQGVGVGVGDPDLPDAQAVEDVEPVEFVLDRRRRFQPEYQPDGARGAGRVDVGDRLDQVEPGCVGEVGQPHAEVGDDVVPPPRRAAGDARGAVHQVVEDDVHPGGAHAGVRGVLPPCPVVGRRLAHVGREPDRVVVQADHQAVAQQRGRPPRLLVRQRRSLVRRHPAEFRSQVELG